MSVLTFFGFGVGGFTGIANCRVPKTKETSGSCLLVLRPKRSQRGIRETMVSIMLVFMFSFGALKLHIWSS